MKNQIIILAFTFIVSSLIAQQKGINQLPTANRQLPTSTYAVIVGISDYQDKDIPDLRFADKDAEAFANFLRSPAGGSLDGDHLQVLINSQATAGRIAEALDALIEKAKKGDQVIIYFSGHGDVEGKKLTQPGFLLCWDSPSRVYMGGGTYSLSFLQEIVSTLSVQNQTKVVVITDACHAGKLAGSQIGGAQLTTANLAKQYANEIKILSCQPNEFSLEGEQWGGGRGVFSYHLVDGLFGLADRNSDGQITLGEIDRYLEDHVTAEAAPQSQVPILLGNKTDLLATVNVHILADLKKNKNNHTVFFAATENKGFEEQVLGKVDSNIVSIYRNFKKAINDKRFLSPIGNCAESYYAQLEKMEALAPLRGIMKRNYAAALQDDAQQVMNTMLKSGLTAEILSNVNAKLFYKNYPDYLEKAAALLGVGHYMYSVLQARKFFFEGKILQDSSAKEKFFQAIKWEPDLPHPYVELIWLMSSRDSVIYYAKKAMELAPSWVVPYLKMVDFYDIGLHEADKAEEMLDKASEIDSNSILVWYEKSRFYTRQNDLIKSEYWLKKVISSSEKGVCFPCAHLNLGTLYRSTSRYNEAILQFKKGLLLDSLNSESLNDFCRPCALSNLGAVYTEIGQFAQAELFLKKSIQTDSNFVKAYVNLGHLYANMNKLVETEIYAKKAYLLDSNNVYAANNLGDIYQKTGRIKEAEALFRKMISIDSSFAVGYLNLAMNQSIQKKIGEAYKYLEGALKNGWTDYNLLQDEPDLLLLREEKEKWNALMEKHFPGKK